MSEAGKDTIIQWARAAKRANEASGEGVIPDERLIRAATAWMTITRSLSMMFGVNVDALTDSLTRSLCVLHVASSFDETPSTPERAALFSTSLDAREAVPK